MKLTQYLIIFMAIAILTTAIATPGLAQEELVCETDVIVQEGDWLSTIAEQAYGDPTLYEAIAFATNTKAQTDSSYATIDSHDVVEPGWKLCVPSQEEAEALEIVAPDNAAVLTADELANATYSGIYDEPITLTNGKYEGEPFVPDGASRPTVTLISDTALYGDLDSDGVEDAAVFLVENSGGSGNFIYIAAQLNQNGLPVDAGAVWIEDRIQIISGAIEDGQVKLEVTAEGPGDAACCKSYKTFKTYALQDGRLAEIPSESSDLVKISADDLNGTTWTLIELGAGQPALAEAPITISFQDGQISGSGGCNNYSGSFSLSEDNPFVITISPVSSTQQACPEPILNQETTYLAALQNSAQWGYLIGHLAIYYAGDSEGYDRLLYAPQVTPETTAAPTEVITYTPAEIPTETQSGSCFANAIGLGRADAWRCTVGNSIYDPCFAVDDAPTIICDANPVTGATGFVLELTEPLPPPDPGPDANAWLVELADGQVCGLMTGTIVGVGDRIAPYGCPDQTYLFEDFQQDGGVWIAEKAIIGLNDNGFFIEESEWVPLVRIWK